MAFSLNIALGPFLVIVVLVVHLVIGPLKNLFKEDLLYCAARHIVAKGLEIHVRTTPKIFEAVGITHIVSGRGLLIRFVQIIMIGNVLLLLISVAFWERSIDQNSVPVSVSVVTTSSFDEGLNAPQGAGYLMSPFPVHGLREENAGRLKPFSQNGTDSVAKYKIREDIEMASRYASACVHTPNSTHHIVYMGAVIKDHNGNRRASCLNGEGISSEFIAATFHAEVVEKDVLQISFQKRISTDDTSTVYRVELKDTEGHEYTGYIAVTLRSYFNANVEWSLYGLLRRKSGNNAVWRISLPLYTPSDGCKSYLSSLLECPFENDALRCPSDCIIASAPDPETVAIKPLQDAGFYIYMPGTEEKDERNSDLLSWMVETDYARFWASRTFSGELRERTRGDRMFYSAYDGVRVFATDGSERESVSFGEVETLLLAFSLGLLFLQILVAAVWKCMQVRKHKIRSEVVSYQALAAMYKAETTGLEVDEGSSTKLVMGLYDSHVRVRCPSTFKDLNGGYNRGDTIYDY